ncbi:MAG TPA: hypothetical protein VKE51_40330, partial [Vicinamibacterales bacterium]|nr:hypothetical protein [Vicinamibacterales bacterium]
MGDFTFAVGTTRADTGLAVHGLFDLSSPDRSPFPSDRFTVRDPDQITGRRVAIPMPTDCIANESDCQDVTVLNRLDGFNMNPQVSIPFDGDIDPLTATSENVYIIALGDLLEPRGSERTDVASGGNADDDGLATSAAVRTGRVIGINQVVWDVESHTLRASTDERLDEHSRYALVVTNGVHAADGRPIEASDEFGRYRNTLAVSADPEARWYRRALLTAEWAARRSGADRHDIVAMSVFTTVSVTYIERQIHDQIFSSPSPQAEFNIGPGGSRAVYPLSSIASVTWNRQLTGGPTLSPLPLNLTFVRFVPGAIGAVALGRYASPDYMAHPGEYIPEVLSRTGVVIPQGTNAIYFNLYLPSGPMPPNGWPVAIEGHGRGGHKNFNVDSSTSILPSHGIAVIAINAVGHGQGPLSTLQLNFTDGTSATLSAGGRGFDQNGDGQIGPFEGAETAAPRTLRINNDSLVQTTADEMALVRMIQGGVDVDGDGHNDLDPVNITYFGHSQGANSGMALVAMTPEIRASALLALGSPILDDRRLSPASRSLVAARLAARTPSLVNSADGITSIDGVPVADGPFFNENMPLRNQPPVINTIPGAVAIQRYLDRASWAGQAGDPGAYAPLFRADPVTGERPRRVLIEIARSDQSNPTVNAITLLRVGDLESQTVLYRHDAFWPTAPSIFKNAHAFPLALPQVAWRPIVISAQEQVATFLASNGTA